MTNEVVYSVGPNDPAEIEDRHCRNCGADMLYRYPDGYSELDNELWIKLDGGYGSFIDTMPERMEFAPRRVDEEMGYKYIPMQEEWTEKEIEHYKAGCAKLYSFVICHECAHRLCELFPAFNEVIKPHTSHSHRTEWVKNNPNHFGADYDSHWNKEDGEDE